MSEVLRHLRRTMLVRDGAGRLDEQLLADYLGRRDEAALEALVRRHGPMVWGVCRRLLGNHHDAEDAFQAAFLVLVRKAASITSRGLLANWLYGVAYRTALNARAAAARRGARERQVAVLPEPEAARAEPGQDLRPLLDQELSRLPDKYRVPVVLCDLEGKTRREAARQLGWPEGTVAGRLARARALLATRLARRGLAVSGGALAAALAPGAAPAAVPVAVLGPAVDAVRLAAAGRPAAGAAAALAEGVVRAMSLAKLKTVAVALFLLAALGAGTAAWTGPGRAAAANPAGAQAAGAPGAAPARARPPAALPPAPKRLDDKDLAELWRKRFAKLAASGQKPGRGTWQVNLDEVHNNPAYKNTCALCHRPAPKPPDLDPLIVQKLAEGVVIRLPRKGGPAADAEFLRRVCLDALGRTPTPLEMYYYLKDTDPEKDRKVVERLLKQEGAEEYVRGKLGAERLTPEQRQLVRWVLAFADGEKAPPPRRAEVERPWRDLFSVPQARPKQEEAKPTAPAAGGEGDARRRREVGLAARQLGEVHQQQGRPAEAEAAYRQALVLQEKLVREFPTARAYRQDLAATLSRLGGLCRQTGRLAEAERLLRQALALLEKE